MHMIIKVYEHKNANITKLVILNILKIYQKRG
jgi:vesicle coat complex subunit